MDESSSKRLDHIAVTVSDLEASVRFYADVLGLKEVERHSLSGDGISRMAGKEGVQLEVVRMVAPDSEDVRIDLQRYVSPEAGSVRSRLGQVGNTHFCLTVSDLDQIHARLTALGVHFVSDPVTLGLEDGAVKVVFMEDLDGYIVELYEA